MDSASCGPSNALTNLSKHSQRDTSLQNEAAQRFQLNNQNGFKTNNFQQTDKTLNQDFENFLGNRFALEFQASRFQNMNHQNMNHQNINHQNINHQNINHQNINHQNINHQNIQNQNIQNQKWVQDFSQLNIGTSKNDWQKQFMGQYQLNQQQQQQQLGHQYGQFVPMAPQIAPQMTPFSLSMRTDLSTPLTEHRELHEQELFNQHFDELEKELQQTETVQENVSRENHTEKEEFAKTAKQVHSSMMSVTNEATSSKFQNSNFLKLMNSISNRSVELDGDKLVNTESGTDIREHLADPLKNEKQEHKERSHLPGINVETPVLPMVGQQTNISRMQQFQQDSNSSTLNEQINSHLPDPLAHIKNGGISGINDPLMAAKIVSGNQIKDQHWLGSKGNDDDWLDMTEDAPGSINETPQYNQPSNRKGRILNELDQEMFDDYRHDDDYN